MGQTAELMQGTPPEPPSSNGGGGGLTAQLMAEPASPPGPSLASRVTEAAKAGVGRGAKAVGQFGAEMVAPAAIHQLQPNAQLNPLERMAAAGLTAAGSVMGGAANVEALEPPGTTWKDIQQGVDETAKNSPAYRALIAAGVQDLPVQYLGFKAFEGVGALLDHTFNWTERAANAVRLARSAPNEEIERRASAEAVRIARRAFLAKQAAGGAAFGAVDVGARRVEGEQVPTYAYTASPLAGAAFASVLGVLGSKVGDLLMRRLQQPIMRLFRQDPYLATQAKGLQRIAARIAKRAGAGPAGSAVMNVLSGVGSPVEKELARAALEADPALLRFDIGKHLLNQTKAGSEAVLTSDPNAPASDPVTLSWEDPLRGQHHEVLPTAKAVRARLKEAREGRIRIIRASGPRAKMDLLGPAIEASVPPPPPNFPQLSETEADKILSQSAPDRIDQYFQGLPRFEAQPVIRDVPAVREPPPGRPYRPGEAYVAARRQGQPTTTHLLGEGAQERQPVGVPGVIANLPDQFFDFSNSLVDGPDGLKDQGFNPVSSGDTTSPHAHPWMDLKAQGQQIPVVVPATDDRMLVSRSTTTDPTIARQEDAPETLYRSHRVKMNPTAQEKLLRTSVPTPIPAERAFPPDPALLNQMDEAAQGDGSLLQRWVDQRRGRGKALWKQLTWSASQTSPDDPRLTPHSARTIVNILGTRLDDLQNRSAADPEYRRIQTHYHRFLQAWGDRLPSTNVVVAVRGSFQDVDGTLVTAHDTREGSVVLHRGSLMGASVEVPAAGETAELSKPLTPGDLNTATGPAAPLDHLPDAQLKAGLNAIEKLLKSQPANPDLLAKRQLLQDAVARRLGQPPHEPAWGKIPKFSKGSVSFPKVGWTRLPDTDALAAMTTAGGHDSAWTNSRGQVRIDFNAEGRQVPLYFPDRETAAGALAGTAHIQSQMAKWDYDVTKAVTTDQLPAMPVQDRVGALFEAFNSPMSRAVDTAARGSWAAYDPLSVLHDGRSEWRQYGVPGRTGELLSEKYLDIRDTFRDMGEVALDQFHRGGGTRADGVRQFETAQSPKHQLVMQTLRRALDTAYAMAEKLGLKDLAPRIPDVANQSYYFHHYFPLAEALKRGEVRLNDDFLQSMVDTGLATDTKDAYQRFMQTGGFVLENRDTLAQKVLERLTRRAKQEGKPIPTIAEAQRIIDTFRSRAASMAPSLQFERSGNPNYSDSLEDSFKDAWNHITNAFADRLAFGEEQEALRDVVMNIHDQYGYGAATNAQQLFDAVRGRVHMSRTPAAAASANIVRTYLSKAFLHHIPQNMFTWARGGLPEYAKALAQVAKMAVDPDALDEVNLAGGAVRRHITDYGYEGVGDPNEITDPQDRISLTKLSRVAGDITTKPLEMTIGTSRKIAATMGQSLFDRWIGRIDDNLDRLNEHMGPFARTRQEWQALDPGGRAEMRRMAGRRMANMALFRFDPLTLAAGSRQSPAIQLFLMFRNYLYPLTRLMTEELVGRGSVIDARRVRAWVGSGILMPLYASSMALGLDKLGVFRNRSVRDIVKKLHKAYHGNPDFANTVDWWIAAQALNQSYGMLTGVGQVLWTHNTQALDNLFPGPPMVGWSSTVLSVTGGLAGAAHDWMSGRNALARYEAMKQAKALTSLFGMSGPPLKKPTKPRW